jgi:glutamate N-acetyltransferase/amino-acid N-acetyltransferase
MKYINGGVCAPKGFKASGVHCGIRKNKSKRDIALIFSEVPASAGAVYTTNLVKGAPLTVTKNNISNGYARAVICNSGNANTCNANGIELATETCKLLASQLNIDYTDVIVASTGVIGQPMTIEPFERGIPQLIKELSDCGNDNASEAIMTTDTVSKQVAVEFELNGVTCKIGGMAKGSGMIHPNMATMLVFLTSDVNITSEMLNKALKSDIQDTFNMISIDGDTSTNDMVSILANGLAGNKLIESETEDYFVFKKALNTLTEKLCKMIAKDGEGATKLIECEVNGAENIVQAKKVAKSVICSSLVKCAMFGADANWGRILCAIGYSGEQVNVNTIDVFFKSKKGEIAVAKNGASLEFSEEKAKEILLEDEILIRVELNIGDKSARAFGCDLTHEYVSINGDYRT